MPYKEKVIEKRYYSIGEVAEEFDVATSLIRFWESEFNIIKPKKNRKGNRQFTKNDLENIRLVYHLVKERGFTLNGAREMLKNDNDEIQSKMEVIDSLTKVKSFLVELRNELH
jgi:DNA-binding transcriptional MerR regulator